MDQTNANVRQKALTLLSSSKPSSTCFSADLHCVSLTSAHTGFFLLPRLHCRVANPSPFSHGVVAVAPDAVLGHMYVKLLSLGVVVSLLHISVQKLKTKDQESSITINFPIIWQIF